MKLTRPLIILFLSLCAGTVLAGQNFYRQPSASLKFPVDSSGQNYAYSLEPAFAGLSFTNPVGMATPPGETNRLFVIERAGRVFVITNLARPTKSLFLDITDRVASDWESNKVEGLTSVAFHPGYATNHLFFVTYTLITNTPAGSGNHNRLSRFGSDPADPGRALKNSELVLITQFDLGAGHNFNDGHFGPDQYLYVSIGDEGDGGTGDDFNNAQKIDKNFFSAIMRLDVDKRPGNLLPNPHVASSTNYYVPLDNPWVGATSFNGLTVDPARVRTEFYAVGFRNPWRISFDPLTQTLFEGDVGQHGREEINVIVKGGNYGWSFKEGTLNGPKGPPPPGLSLIDPIQEYGTGFSTNQGFSVIGGVVYRGQRMPELYGWYIFADYVSGNVWRLKYDNGTVVPFQFLLGHRGIAGFGRDPRNGDVLAADHDGHALLRLVSSSAVSNGIPTTLADTGIFSNPGTLQTEPGLVPYDVNAPFWSDHASKKRWFSVPDNTFLHFDSEGAWSYPTGTVWVKHFELELTNGVPASTRRLETRVLVKNPSGVYGVTYRWGASATNALLVPDEGMDESFAIYDGGNVRTQTWHYPSRSECLLCHNPRAGFALGFNTVQLNRDYNYGSLVTNQLYAISDAGYFDSQVPDWTRLRALAALQEANVSREFRVRSYLAANCAHCHQPGGTGRGFWDARITTPTRLAGLINGPLMDSRGDPGNVVVRPGVPAQSMLLTRIAQFDTYHMPPLATSVLNSEAVNLVSGWIAEDLRTYETFAEWQVRFFGNSSAASASPEADPDADGVSNFVEYLTGTSPVDARDSWKLYLKKGGSGPMLVVRELVNRGYQLQTAASLQPPVFWEAFSTGQRVSFPASPGTNQILLPGNLTNKFFRLQVIEP